MSMMHKLLDKARLEDLAKDETEKPAGPSLVVYAWAVDGLSRMYFGEYAEIDAMAEARRCGGTATAFPLYRRA